MTIRKKQNKLDQRTKIIMIIVLIFVVILAFSYIKEDRQRAAAGGIPDQETRREEKRIKEEKRIYQDKRIY